jgi:hypothetical protein
MLNLVATASTCGGVCHRSSGTTWLKNATLPVSPLLLGALSCDVAKISDDILTQVERMANL